MARPRKVDDSVESPKGDSSLVKMVRREGCEDGYPSSALVHPDEVENWKQYDWMVAENGTD